MDSIFVRGIKFTGPHGWTESERNAGSSFVVDVMIATDLSRAGNSDDIQDTIDWRKIADAVVETGTMRSFKLVERLASEIVDKIVALCPASAEVEARVEKTSAVLRGEAHGAMVTVRRVKE